MFDEKALWQSRFRTTTKELGKYLKYIFNGHFVIVLVFLLGTAAFYYQEWVKTISPDFPAALVMAVLLSLILTYSPIYTFLLEADRVFLLPLESKLTKYFQRSIIVSFFAQAYLIIMGLAVVMPMYAKVNNGNFKAFGSFLLFMLIIKGLNLLIRWQIQYYVETSVHLSDLIIRFMLNGVFLFLLFSNANILLIGIVGLLYIILLFYFRKKVEEKGLKWELLISLEEKRLMAFYRLANLFTDVPKLRDRVKRRKWLDPFLSGLAFNQGQTFSHLYIRTFLRSGDYLGLFVRLTIIGFSFLFFISSSYGQIFFILLFIYLTGFQLLPLWHHYQNKLWVDLYPVRESVREQSFLKLLSSILSIQAVLLSVALFIQGNWQMGIGSIAVGFIFSYLFVYVYSKRRIDA